MMSSNHKQRLVQFDWAMKTLLRDKANFDVLEGFLTCLLEETIVIEELLESESNQEERTLKFNRVDLKCKDSTGRQIIIEIQSQRVAAYYERIAFGASRALVESVALGEPFSGIAKVISISILFHPLHYPEQNSDYLYYGRNDILGCHTHQPLLEKHALTGRAVTSGDIFPEFYVISVQNFNNDVRTALDQWVYLFKHGQTKANFNSPGIESAEKKLDYLSLTNSERKQYDSYWFNMDNNISAFENARAEARAEALEEGEAKGLKEGRKEGEYTAKIDSARKLLAMQCLSVEQIAQATGLSVSDVTKLQP